MDEAIRAADERLEHVSLDEDAQDLYRRRQMALMDQAGYNDGIAASRREGIEIGRWEGREEGQETATLNIARKMKARGRPLAEIAEDTGLSLEVIEQL